MANEIAHEPGVHGKLIGVERPGRSAIDGFEGLGFRAPSLGVRLTHRELKCFATGTCTNIGRDSLDAELSSSLEAMMTVHQKKVIVYLVNDEGAGR